MCCPSCATCDVWCHTPCAVRKTPINGNCLPKWSNLAPFRHLSVSSATSKLGQSTWWLQMVILIFLSSLWGYAWFNILILSPKRVKAAIEHELWNDIIKVKQWRSEGTINGAYMKNKTVVTTSICAWVLWWFMAFMSVYIITYGGIVSIS